jgi:hypothetical protein
MSMNRLERVLVIWLAIQGTGLAVQGSGTQGNVDNDGANVLSYSNGGVMMAGNRGSAGFSIPVQLPEGPNHLTPVVSLSYDSSLRTNNGLCGAGWSLVAGGVITKAGQRGEPVFGFDLREHRFFLNLAGLAGGELFLVDEAAGEFRTRHDQGLRIRMGRNRSGTYIFDNVVVWDKSGVTYRFRNLTGDPHPSVLFLTRIESPTGQKIYYRYKRGTDTGLYQASGDAISLLTSSGGDVNTVWLVTHFTNKGEGRVHGVRWVENPWVGNNAEKAAENDVTHAVSLVALDNVL